MSKNSTDATSHYGDTRADPVSVCKAFISTARVASDRRRFADVIAIARPALELAERTPGLSTHVLELLELLSTAVWHVEGATAALSIQQRVVVLREATTRDPRFPSAVVTLGLLLERAGRRDEAEVQLERAMTIIEQGADSDFNTVGVASGVAEALYDEGSHPTLAERLFRKARRGLAEVLGADHPEFARLGIPLARLAILSERTDEAERLLVDSISVLEREPSPSPRLAEGLMYMGQLRHTAGAYGEAELLFARAEATFYIVKGIDALEGLGCYFQRGVVYRDQGKMDQAEPIFIKALEALSKSLGDRHPAVANVLEAYSELLDSTGRKEEAALMAARAGRIKQSKP